MPTNIQSIQPSLAKLYESKKKVDTAGEYYDFDNDGKLSKGELVSENQSTEKFLEHVVYAENNIVHIKQVYDVLTVANDRTQQSINTFESNLIARASLLASGVAPKDINGYLEKLDALFAGYEKSTNPKANEQQKIVDLHGFLNRNVDKFRSGQYRMDIAINAQIKAMQSQTGSGVEVGNCVSLTALFNILAVRAGLDVKTVLRSGHVFSSYKGAPIENTSSNLRGAYKLYDYHATAFSVVTAMYDWQNTKDVLSGQFKKIIGLQESIIAIDPKFAKPYIILGDAYLFNGEFQKSIEWFKKGLELEKDPGMRSAVYFDMGLAYMGLGEVKEAQKCFLFSFKGEQAR